VKLHPSFSFAGISAALILLLCTASYAAPSFPKLTGRVVDQAKLISAGGERSLTSKLEAHEKKTTNQVVVVTLNNLGGYSIDEYGYQLGRHWGIGQKASDNGVLLIVAKKERKVRIEVGYGLEGSLTDAIAANIIHQIILPEFKRGKFESGINKGVNAILLAVSDKYKMKQVESGWAFADFIIFIFVVMFIFSTFFGGGSGGRSRSRGGRYHSSSGVFGSSSGGFGGGGFGGGGGGFGGGGASGGW